MAELSSGVQFENTLYNQFARMGQIQYYALKTGQEIDFILDKKFAFEAKETPVERDLNHLANMCSNVGIANFRLVGRNQSPKFSNYVWAGSIV